ncbi:MAG: fumarate hydratase [Fusobacteriaceae bacterium]|nr:fumarate hydratase [Fusobacteriaceae bacterium]MBN2838297.1 fumarate hydratase [Fusobacteriaceae bacterium]
MRNFDVKIVSEEIEKLCMNANFYIPKDVMNSLVDSLEKEESPVAKDILSQIIENDKLAQENSVPMCQDTGLTVVFLEIGRDIHLNGDIYEAINTGVKNGYEKGYLRKSIVQDPFNRVNTKDNTPAIIHTKIVDGDKIKIVVAPKGGGSENMSTVKMMKPSDGVEGVKKFVLDFIDNAGGNPCPPIVVGIGIGGNLEKSALLAKEALLREINDINPIEFYKDLEEELLEKINKLGIGPMGLGGRTTCLSVKIKAHPCHIAQLPVAININCHAARHKEVIL